MPGPGGEVQQQSSVDQLIQGTALSHFHHELKITNITINGRDFNTMKSEMNPDGILCAVDVNDFDQDVIDLAATFARQAGRDLELLHVTLVPDPNNAAWPAYLGSPDAVIADHQKLLKIGTTVDGVNVVHHHLSGLPSRKVLDFVKRNKPQLLVLGTHARRGLARLLGSMAAKIMRHAECPVMVLRQKNTMTMKIEKPNEDNQSRRQNAV